MKERDIKKDLRPPTTTNTTTIIATHTKKQKKKEIDACGPSKETDEYKEQRADR